MTTIIICISLEIVFLVFLLSANRNAPNYQVPPLHLPMQPPMPNFYEDSFRHIEAMYKYKKQVEREKIAAVTTVVVLFLFFVMLFAKS